MSGIMQSVVSNWKVGVSGPTPFDFINPPQLVSATFNGTTQRLTTTGGVGTAMGTGDFTWECWVRPTGTPGYQTFIDTRGIQTGYSGVNTDGVYFGLDNGTLYPIYYQNSALITSSIPVTLNAWSHVAAVRSSGTTTIYVNGVSGGTYSDNLNLTAPWVNMGGTSTAAINFTGQISNVRLVKGTAVYTSNFTTPTKPLTDITNTSLLVSMGATPFIDTSTNAYTITNVGSVALSNLSPFPATWTDSISSIVATVATNVNSSGNNPTYVADYGGGLNIAQTAQTYVDVPTTYSGAAGFTISMAANIPQAQGSHYVAIYDGNTIDRAGYYINSRQWVGDGLEVGTQAGWGASNSTTDPAMATLAWWDFVYNGRFVSAYKNGSVVTGLNNYDMGVGNANTGWLNPLRFVGDESISSSNTMWPGTVYRIKCQAGALNSSQITTQFNAVRSTYGL